MAEYLIYTDSAADLPQEEYAKYDIRIVPMDYLLNGESVTFDTGKPGRDDLCGALFEAQKIGADVSTTQITPYRYIETWTSEMEAGNDILYLCFSSGMSATFDNARMAADQLMEEYPGRTIKVVDSLSGTCGQGILTVTAAMNRDEKGMSIEDMISEAEDGDPDLMEHLAQAYLNGDGVEQDFKKSAYWWEKLAETDNSVAQFNIGLYYAKGCGVARDFAKAAEWMKKAADNGDEDAPTPYEMYSKASENLKKAETGDAAAQAEMAKLFTQIGGSLDQFGSGNDYQEAFKWAKKSADQGNLEGMYCLALCYEHGRGISMSPSKAVSTYEKAAKQGHAPSQWNLAVCYLNGNGVQRDETKGYSWAYQAADQGNELAINGLEAQGKTIKQIIERCSDPEYNVTLEGTQYEGRADRCERIRAGMELQYKIIKDKNGRFKLNKRGELLALKRSRIIAGAQEKLDALREQMQPYTKDNNILVYCGSTNVLDESDDRISVDESEIRQIEAVTKILGNELAHNEFYKEICKSIDNLSLEVGIKILQLDYRGYLDKSKLVMIKEMLVDNQYLFNTLDIELFNDNIFPSICRYLNILSRYPESEKKLLLVLESDEYRKLFIKIIDYLEGKNICDCSIIDEVLTFFVDNKEDIDMITKEDYELKDLVNYILKQTGYSSIFNFKPGNYHSVELNFLYFTDDNHHKKYYEEERRKNLDTYFYTLLSNNDLSKEELLDKIKNIFFIKYFSLTTDEIKAFYYSYIQAYQIKLQKAVILLKPVS